VGGPEFSDWWHFRLNPLCGPKPKGESVSLPAPTVRSLLSPTEPSTNFPLLLLRQTIIAHSLLRARPNLASLDLNLRTSWNLQAGGSGTPWRLCLRLLGLEQLNLTRLSCNVSPDAFPLICSFAFFAAQRTKDRLLHTTPKSFKVSVPPGCRRAFQMIQNTAAASLVFPPEENLASVIVENVLNLQEKEKGEFQPTVWTTIPE